MFTNQKDASRSVVVLLDQLRTGGTEKQSVWLEQALQECGWQSRLYLLFPEAEESATRSGSNGICSLLGAVRRLFLDFRQNCPNVLICMGRTANSLGFLIQCRFPSVRLVSTCRTNRSLPFLYRLNLKRAELCLVNSLWARDEVVRVAGLPSSRVVHIENALLRTRLFDLDVSPEAKAAARHQLGLGLATRVLCNISSFVPGKNKTDLIQAFALSRIGDSAVLLLVGDGSGRADCEACAQRLGVSGQVRFLGRMESVEAILQASDLFVSTSLRDSLPNALIEAQAAGLPVVAYDVAGVVEAFEPECSGLAVPCGDIAAFSRALERLSGSPELLKLFADAARRRALQRYAPTVIRRRYESALKGLLY